MDHDLEWMRKVPITHRGLHDLKSGSVENSLSAASEAIKKGYSIELDLQLTKDRKLVVFHDFTLDSLTSLSGLVRDRTLAELSEIKLENTQDRIPSLQEFLDLVDGQVGIVIELKGVEGKDAGYIDALNKALKNYTGPHAVMSFDPWLLKAARNSKCTYPLGLTAQGNDSFYQAHQQLVDELKIDFISYGIKNLPCKFATDFKKTGKPVICWTVRNTADWKHALIYADQITFERIDPHQ